MRERTWSQTEAGVIPRVVPSAAEPRDVPTHFASVKSIRFSPLPGGWSFPSALPISDARLCGFRGWLRLLGSLSLSQRDHPSYMCRSQYALRR